MNIAVLDAKTLGDDLSLAPLEALGKVTRYDLTTPEERAQRLKYADIAVINKIRMDRAALEDTSVKLICVAATGYDNIDLAYCRQKGIAVANVPGYAAHSVAQIAVTMALMLVSHMEEYVEEVRSGRYSHSDTANRLIPPYHEIRGMTWGIVGYGAIGRATANIARALGCEVLVHTRTARPGVPCVDMDTLCRRADILSLHVPLSEETRNLLDRRRIGLLKPDAVVVNVARGAVTEEAALAEALAEGRIGGLGVDVYSREPFPESHPFYALREHPRALFTPHMAWGAVESRERCLDEIAQNIRAFYEGIRRNRVD